MKTKIKVRRTNNEARLEKKIKELTRGMNVLLSERAYYGNLAAERESLLNRTSKLLNAIDCLSADRDSEQRWAWHYSKEADKLREEVTSLSERLEEADAKIARLSKELDPATDAYLQNALPNTLELMRVLQAENAAQANAIDVLIDSIKDVYEHSAETNCSEATLLLLLTLYNPTGDKNAK